jgi:uncharacterized protein Veg
MPAEKKPRIQFMACGKAAATKSIALATATIATQVGRSLLLDASFGRRRENSKAEVSNEPVPDTFVPELYHYVLEKNALSLIREGRALFWNIFLPFQFVAIDSGDAAENPTGMALAPLCSGTILVVRAAASPYAAVKHAHMQIVNSGGNVIGLILEHAPGKLPRWAGGA